MNKGWIIVLVIVAVALLIWAGNKAYAFYSRVKELVEKLTFSFTNVRLGAFSLTNIEVLFDVNLVNGSDMDFTIDSYDFKGSISGTTVGAASETLNRAIGTHSTVTLSGVRILINPQALPDVLRELLQRNFRNTTMDITGNIKVSRSGVSVNIPVQKSFSIG